MKSNNFTCEKNENLEFSNGGYVGGVIRLGGHLFSRIGSRLMSTGTGVYLEGAFDLMKMTADDALEFFVGVIKR